jgi:hypothetical protein
LGALHFSIQGLTESLTFIEFGRLNLRIKSEREGKEGGKPFKSNHFVKRV